MGQQPLVVDSFKNCEGLSRIAFLDGNTAVMLGEVVSVISKADMPAEETAKKKSVFVVPIVRRGQPLCRFGCAFLKWHESSRLRGARTPGGCRCFSSTHSVGG